MKRLTAVALVGGAVIAGSLTLTLKSLADAASRSQVHCIQLLPDADHSDFSLHGYNYSGEGGAWHTPEGALLGYASYEDSIIYNRPNCLPHYLP